MRINLRTFEIVTLFIFVIGVVGALSEIAAVRAVGYLMALSGAFLFYQITEERKRRTRRHQFRQRMAHMMHSYGDSGL